MEYQLLAWAEFQHGWGVLSYISSQRAVLAWKPLKQMNVIEILTRQMQFRSLIAQEILISQATAELSLMLNFFNVSIGPQDTEVSF